MGALVLPISLSHGKDLLYGVPIFSNADYSIRGYSNYHRADGEYTYNNDSILAVPVIYKLEKIDRENFFFTTVTINKSDYCNFYGAQLFIRFLQDGCEKVVYSEYLQTSVYNEALKAENKTLELNKIIDFCKFDRKTNYNEVSRFVKKLHVFTAEEIKGFSIRALESDLCEAKLDIDWYNNSEQTSISLITDAHINYVNKKDFLEENPAVMSTYQKRIWCCDGQTVPNFINAMENANFSDKIVLTGDIMDYLSNGCLQLAQRLAFWNCDISGAKYNKGPKVVATLGNHEPTRQMEGLVPDKHTLSENKVELQKYWPNNVFYHSETVYNSNGKNPVKIVLLDNSTGAFSDPLTDKKLERDLEYARNINMQVLIFAHIPIYNGTDEVLRGLLIPNFKLPQTYFCCRNRGNNAVTDAVYDLITENADIIKGIFTRHQHEYVYTRVKGKGKSANVLIPQHIFQAVSYGKGYILNILIK